MCQYGLQMIYSSCKESDTVHIAVMARRDARDQIPEWFGLQANKQCAANVHVNIGRVVALSTQSAHSVIFSSSVPDRLAVAMILVLACSVLHSILSFRCTHSFACTFVL